MRWSRSIPCAAALLSVLAACAHYNTLPKPLAADDPILRYDLEIPSWLEIQTVDFTATTFSNVSGSRDLTLTDVGGRAFVKVYGVHRQTGERYLLIYENLAKRKQPAYVIRFQPG